ncbi:MAG: hypothetical protein F4227_05580 [Gammaproteobacteria bacterium]|nr:hypothetical protein [Gammaproteobacteria bacterium]MYF02438.1 hypothetical protein [Gammaproteobacteria bacterium]MYI76847.1 hypothetical protein [Gammaproteobacteria bacterium]
MKKAGKIVGSIFASLGILVCLFTLAASAKLQHMKENPDIEAQSQIHSNESEMDEVLASLDLDESDVSNKELNFKKTMTHSWVGALLFGIILLCVLLNVPKDSFFTPLVAVVAAGGGAIFCGVGFAFLFVMALIGSLLVSVANLK